MYESVNLVNLDYLDCTDGGRLILVNRNKYLTISTTEAVLSLADELLVALPKGRSPHTIDDGVTGRVEVPKPTHL